MKQLTELKEIIGKVISSATKDDDFVFIAFEDGSCMLLKSVDSYGIPEITFDTSIEDLSQEERLSLGLISEEEYEQNTLERDNENIAREKENRHKLWIKLNKEFKNID